DGASHPTWRRGALDGRASRRALRRKSYLARGVVRTGQDDARVVRRARPVAGAYRTRARIDSGWMRDRRAAGEFTHRGDSRTRKQDPVSSRLRRGARRETDGRPDLA